jgi:2-polyprenyl-6-methoxyphenol hydroxylase-like FAD-dependent oxidoreductase
MARTRQVLIVGGGIAGLAAAICLRKSKIETEVVEIAERVRTFQVGIVLQSNAVRALAAIGVGEKCVAAGFAYEGIDLCDLNGRVFTHLPGIPLAGPTYPSDLGMTRPALHSILAETAIELGAKVRTGVTVSALAQAEDRVTARFSDGTTGQYDLLVGADGIYSKVRGMIFGDRFKPRYTGQANWRYNLPRRKEINRTTIYVDREAGAVGFVPLSSAEMYLFASTKEPDNPRFAEDLLPELLRERLIRFTCVPIIAEVREVITDPMKVLYRPLETLLVEAPWYHGCVLLIGDAAHAMTPHLRQGAAQAIEDAAVLGELLAQELPMRDLLERFMCRRYERCKFAVEASAQIGVWEQNPALRGDASGLAKQMLKVAAQPP